MCHTIITHLECGHRETGPIFRCEMAVASKPRGYPYDDGRLVICQPNEVHCVDQKSFCGECIQEMRRQLLTAACPTCRRSIVTLWGESVLDTLPREPDTAGQQVADSQSDTETLCHW